VRIRHVGINFKLISLFVVELKCIRVGVFVCNGAMEVGGEVIQLKNEQGPK